MTLSKFSFKWSFLILFILANMNSELNSFSNFLSMLGINFNTMHGYHLSFSFFASETRWLFGDNFSEIVIESVDL